MKTFFLSISCISIAFLLTTCTQNWTKAIQKGEISNERFSQTMPFEIISGLIIVPIEIRGQQYRFLFDSGAPTSISHQIQSSYHFKTISRGKAVDTEDHRIKIKYVEVDEMLINSIPFLNQTAFVGDFEANPVLKCFQLDGILGSNTMRYCNWTIDYAKQEITFFNSAYSTQENEISIPFYTNDQFDILVNLKIGDVVVKRLKIDYGSSGSISFPKSVFEVLEKEGEVDKMYIESGFSQSGMFGEVNNFTSNITYIDSIYLGDYLINDIMVRSKTSSLIGGHFLSEAIVTIDWEQRKLHMRKNPGYERNENTWGYRIGYDKENDLLYIQSVIKGSNAYDMGIKPNMIVNKVDNLDFEESSNFCDYIDHMNQDLKELSIEVVDELNIRRLVRLEKEKLE